MDDEDRRQIVLEEEDFEDQAAADDGYYACQLGEADFALVPDPDVIGRNGEGEGRGCLGSTRDGGREGGASNTDVVAAAVDYVGTEGGSLEGSRWEYEEIIFGRAGDGRVVSATHGRNVGSGAKRSRSLKKEEWICGLCGWVLARKFLFRRHVVRLHRVGSSFAQWVCVECGRGFHFASLLDSHDCAAV